MDEQDDTKTVGPQERMECPPCPSCPTVGTRPKYIKVTTEQLLYDIAMDGIVVNEDRARAGPCKCVPTNDGGKLCWDNGIIGALSRDQIDKYCANNVEEYDMSKKMKKVEEVLQMASTECEVGKTYTGGKINSLEDRLRCMSYAMGGV